MKRILILTVVLALVMSCFGTFASAADTPGYIISGSAQGSDYTLEIKATDIFAFAGRIGLQFDTEKVALQGGDSLAAFTLGETVSPVPEVKPESEMVSASGGYACLAWYSTGLDALQSEKTVATLSFKLQDGVTADDIDSATFRLRCIDDGDFGPWRAAASMEGRGEREPTPYEYMTDRNALNVSFTYEGSDRTPTNGYTVRLLCRDVLGNPVAATLMLNAKTYSTDSDGAIELVLGQGQYLYRAVASGYGDRKAKLNVRGDAETTVTFVNDADLVAKAARDLKIGYQTGDSAQKVTGTVILPQTTDDGVNISWQSSEPNVITREGLVYLPSETGVNVTLTATLSRGSSTATKTFSVYVCSQLELRPVISGDGGNSGGGGGGGGTTTTPDKEDNTEDTEITPPVAASRFTDLAGFDWAKDSIERMAAAGIIQGTSQTTFTPRANIRRGDFVLLLMRMFDLPAASAEDFADVPKTSYYYSAIAQARAMGIAQGTGDNRFNPDAPITRQEMITFVMRALNTTSYIPLSAARNDLTSFTDRALVAQYAFDSMSAAVAEGLIVGSNGKLNPTGNTTRAEAAVFIARIYDTHNS